MLIHARNDGTISGITSRICNEYFKTIVLFLIKAETNRFVVFAFNALLDILRTSNNIDFEKKLIVSEPKRGALVSMRSRNRNQ